ncbi:MAG TPA: hypothetical protein PL155_01440 [Candidatus Omnitrophota bacterium]|nr:hypothetical protein [Candidatus Omnitrophota bacterium]HPD84850.1 hypothetical protein [Candidatus Omnitrophota bacterium]HRZ03708.1 hypothetical protein [Candidatus Omnitrophota bacterium]
MKNKKLIVLAGILALVLMPAISYATDLSEEEVTPRIRKIYLGPQKSLLEKGKFKYLLAVTEGFDNNAYLDSQREADAFTQTLFRASFLAPLTKKTEGLFEYEMMSLFYAGESDLNLIKNGLRFGADYKLNKKVNLIATYSFDSMEFLKSGSDDYLDNTLELKMRHKLPYKMFHSLAYDILYRNYMKRYTRTALATDTDKERTDVRNVVEYEIGKYFKKDLLKVSFQYFNNNSNETYLKYYDYDSYKVGTSLTHIFDDKLAGVFSFWEQYRDYRSRTLMNDAGNKEKERTFLFSTGLLYNLNKAVSFGLNYTYRQNYSNEPVDKYSGSLISASTYYKF